MFVVLSMSSSDWIFVEIHSIKNYKYVALVNMSIPEEQPSTVYVLGDFTEVSYVEGRYVGLIGTSGTRKPCYIPINIRKNYLGIRLTSGSLEPYKPSYAKLTLHFKK